MERNVDSQIFTIIDEIDDYIASCKPKFMSNNEIIINKETMDDYLRELRRKAPDEIERYRKIIRNQEAIIEDARNKASVLINEAVQQQDEMVSQNEIMSIAYKQADDIVVLARQQAQGIVDQAASDAYNLRNEANAYLEGIMVYLEELLDSASASASSHYGQLIEMLNKYSAKVHEDHKSLHPETASAETAAPAEATAATEEE